MGIEKEYRYKVTDEQIEKIQQICKCINEKSEQIDLTLGFAGFESLYKYGYVCRVRKKANKIWMEIKNLKDDGAFYETKININNFNDGISFLTALGMKAYMYMKRTREILDYKGLKIFIDDIELLGKFVEIEFQNVQDAEKLIEEFIKETTIEPTKQPLYGDILNQLIKNDDKFKNNFQKELNKFVKECKN